MKNIKCDKINLYFIKNVKKGNKIENIAKNGGEHAIKIKES